MKIKSTPFELFKEPKEIINDPKAILLIDNNEIDLFVNQRFLENYGITSISSFRNPKDALIHLKDTNTNYFLILIDIYLPIIDGFEFIDTFNGLELNKQHGEICILSASVNPLDKEKAMTNQVKFFEKPLSLTDLGNEFNLKSE